MGGGIPTPPSEDAKMPSSRKASPSTKPLKPVHRTKRVSTHSPTQAHHHDHILANASADSRHKRVWKACERCRMKKTKCDGEFPCKRCKDDGLVCTAGVRKKTEYKQLPRGYAEVLEHTQFALIATVHKLYAMVRNGQQWDLGEPELNDRGQPIIHNIATKLGCIRPNADIDLPVHSVFPEDEAGLTELARQLEEQQQERDLHKEPAEVPVSSAKRIESMTSRTERESSSESEPDHSDFERDLRNYRQQAFGSHPMTLSPQSFSSVSYNDFDSVPGSDIDAGAAMFPNQPSPAPPSATMATAFPNNSTAAVAAAWSMRRSTAAAASPLDLTTQYLHQINAGLTNVDLLSQGLLESEFGTLKPHVMNCPNPEVMMGMGDPMIYSGYDGEPMRL